MSRINTFNELASLSKIEKNIITRFPIMIDVFWENLIYKTELQDYFQYEFYKLKNSERREYMTFAKLRETIYKCNNIEKRECFDDKAQFNKIFKNYINRDWIDLSTSNFQDFLEFVNNNNSFFVKSKSGMFGKNAGKYQVHNLDKNELQNLYNDLKEKDCIIEELIEQNFKLEKFNETSVNTLRIVTLLCADGTPKIMAGVLRLGRKGKTADNFHHFGIAATIDVEKGIVNSPGIDREFNRYLVHPDSGEQIIGYNIPCWNEAVNLVKKSARIIPDVRYIGWDVAIDSGNEVQLIEGNFGADPDVTQMPCRTGCWERFKKEIDLL